MATFKSIVTQNGVILQKGTPAASRITLTSPASVTPYTLTLPSTAGNSGQFMQTNGSGTAAWADATATAANDNTFYIYNNSDNTKHMKFSAANIAGSTTRTLAMPNRNIDMAANDFTGFAGWTDSGTYYSTVTTAFTLLCGGYGYINGTRVDFAAQGPITLGNQSTTYVGINASGTLTGIDWTVISASDYENNIMLFEVLYDGTVYLIKNEQHPWNFEQSISGFFHNNLGTIIRGAGAVISVGGGTAPTNRQLNITPDTYEDHGITMAIPSATPLTWQLWYINGSGKWIRHSTGTDFASFWSNAGTATAGTANGNRVVYRIYVTNGFAADGTQSPTYVAVMNTALYSSLAAANTAINAGTIQGPTNALFSIELCQLGYIVVRTTTGPIYSIEQVTVQKNTFNAKYVGGTTSGSHLLLSDLTAGTYTDGGHGSLVQLNSTASAPTINSDVTAYKLGTVWVRTDTDDVYMCQNNTDGNAVWFCLNQPILTSLRSSPRTITAAGPTALDNTYGLVLCDCTSNNVGISLPTLATYPGIRYRVVKIDSSANTVTITPNGSEKIDVSLSSMILTTQGGNVELTNCTAFWAT